VCIAIESYVFPFLFFCSRVNISVKDRLWSACAKLQPVVFVQRLAAHLQSLHRMRSIDDSRPHAVGHSPRTLCTLIARQISHRLHRVQSFDHSRPLSSLSSLSSLFQLFNLFACYHRHHSHRSSGTASTASGATHSLLTTQGLQVGRCATTTTQPSVRLAFACAVELLAMRPSGERERLPC
jgi:hypothetical protein